LIIPVPTPIEIESVLAGIMDGTSAFARWVKSNDDNLANTLWWADVLSPADELLACVGGGPTPSEAAAAAWIDFCLGAWWFDGETGDHVPTREQYMSVPRRVPDYWRFDLYAAPTAFAGANKIQ
jgi:hypothetical protein